MKQFSCEWGNLAFRVEGEGKENYVFVHNAGGNHQLIQATSAYFSKKGKALCLDLRGHGKSQAPEMNYTVDSYARDVLSLCQHCRMEKIVFIGLNFGGNIGIALDQISPHLLSKLVLIEPPLLMEPWIFQSVQEHIGDLRDEKRLRYAEQLVNSLIVQASAEEREIAKKAFETTPRYVQISTYENLIKWDQDFKKEGVQCKVPTLFIQTSKPFCREEKLHAYFPHLYSGRVIGSGPWATLEVPDQVNAMIERFLVLKIYRS